MAAASSTLFSFSFPFDPQIQTLSFPLSSAKPRFSPKPFSTFKLTSTHSSSSSSLTVSDDPFNTGRFLSNDELRRLRLLETFLYRCDLPSGGSLSVRVMRPHETDPTVLLLAASFAESMLLPQPYVKFLAFLVKQYLLDRRSLMPHTATLVAFYTQTAAAAADQDQEQEQEARLAGTVELSFDIRGANATVPSPTPPRDKPYICNMAVRKSLRSSCCHQHQESYLHHPGDEKCPICNVAELFKIHVCFHKVFHHIVPPEKDKEKVPKIDEEKELWSTLDVVVHQWI
ncbi:hypothetical protein D0Y65_002835 [Glycine soja]|uniref:Uncharacterized protein n=1 Tax=Glycine soja TaxID=3848 RepID=A0A445LJ14_GLYSO|nr:hypothetical protein D0Y65_002835 [Glycine soja]RZC23175.1 hypothetical protein D0Y65_002835 [Glycine soja]